MLSLTRSTNPTLNLSHQMNISKPSDFGRALKQGPYAWPGGYPLFFVTEDGAAISFAAARKEAKLICDAIRDRSRSRNGWRVVACEVNWEDSDLVCDHTGKQIECAYGES